MRDLRDGILTSHLYPSVRPEREMPVTKQLRHFPRLVRAGPRHGSTTAGRAA